MLIIGEKLNGTLKKTGAAIAAQDVAFVQDLALRQVAAGADFIDVNAGTAPECEPDDLIWLVDSVQAVTDKPLCLDSANPAALVAGARPRGPAAHDQLDQRRDQTAGGRAAARAGPGVRRGRAAAG